LNEKLAGHDLMSGGEPHKHTDAPRAVMDRQRLSGRLALLGRVLRGDGDRLRATEVVVSSRSVHAAKLLMAAEESGTSDDVEAGRSKSSLRSCLTVCCGSNDRRVGRHAGLRIRPARSMSLDALAPHRMRNGVSAAGARCVHSLQ